MTAGIEFQMDGMPFDDSLALDNERSLAPDTPPTLDTITEAIKQGALTPGTAQAVEPTLEAAASDAFAPPKSLSAYDFSPLYARTPATDADLADQLGIQRCLFEAGIPVFAVNAAIAAMAQSIKNGPPSIDGGRIELERRHGSEAARAIINDAGKLFAKLDALDPRIGDALANTGAVNSAYLLQTMATLWRQNYANR